MFIVFPYAMHAQRVDHVTSRVCGHISVAWLLHFCVQLSFTYRPTASFYLYDLRFIFQGLTKVCHDCATMMMSHTSEPPNSSHQVSTMLCVVMLWADLISWFKWQPFILSNVIMKVKSLQHASRACDKILHTKTE